MIFECSWRRAGAKGKVTAEKVKVASSFKLQDHFKISFYNFNQLDTAKQGKRSELGKRNADRKSTLTEKKEMLTKFCQIWGIVLSSMTLLSELFFTH